MKNRRVHVLIVVATLVVVGIAASAASYAGRADVAFEK